MGSKRSRRSSVTAGDLLADLEQDPEYQRRQVEVQRQQQQNIEEYLTAAAPVLQDLAQAGVHVDRISADQLIQQDYKAAIPILLRWLQRVDNLRIKEAIVRSLSVPWAKPTAAPALVDAFRQAPDDPPGLKQAIGNALSIVADDSVFQDIVALARDKRHGQARVMVVEALANMRDPRAVDVLCELLADEEVAAHAVVTLGKLKAARARPQIEPFLNHSEGWVRKEAKRALAKIDKAKK
jgi:HEAT repeat protein